VETPSESEAPRESKRFGVAQLILPLFNRQSWKSPLPKGPLPSFDGPENLRCHTASKCFKSHDFINPFMAHGRGSKDAENLWVGRIPNQVWWLCQPLKPGSPSQPTFRQMLSQNQRAHSRASHRSPPWPTCVPRHRVRS